MKKFVVIGAIGLGVAALGVAGLLFYAGKKDETKAIAKYLDRTRGELVALRRIMNNRKE